MDKKQTNSSDVVVDMASDRKNSVSGPRTRVIDASTQVSGLSVERVANSNFAAPTLSAYGQEGLQDVVVIPLSRRRSRSFGLALSFLFFVVLPFGALLTYFLEYASPEYYSEFRFSVVEVTPSNGPLTAVPAAGANAAIAAAVGGAAGMVSSSPQNYVVVDYLQSRQVVDELSKRIDLKSMYSRPQIDPWNRLEAGVDMEGLSDYWRKHIIANYDPITGLASAQVKAFTPRDALVIAENLVKLSEELVNRIASRTNEDAVRFAEDEVTRARDHLEQERQELAKFRAEEGVIDPTSSVVSSNIQLYASLRATLSQLETDYNTLLTQGVLPKAPTASLLRSKIDSTKNELKSVESEVSSNRAGRIVLAAVVAKFEALQLNRTHAETLLLSALQSLDRARANAAAQHLYLTPYMQPYLPTRARGPFVTRSMLIAGLILVGAWLAGVLVYRSIRIANA